MREPDSGGYRLLDWWGHDRDAGGIFFAEVAATTSRRRAFIVAVVSIDSVTTARIGIARSTGEGNHLFSGCLGTGIEVLG